MSLKQGKSCKNDIPATGGVRFSVGTHTFWSPPPSFDDQKGTSEKAIKNGFRVPEGVEIGQKGPKMPKNGRFWLITHPYPYVSYKVQYSLRGGYDPFQTPRGVPGGSRGGSPPPISGQFPITFLVRVARNRGPPPDPPPGSLYMRGIFLSLF